MKIFTPGFLILLFVSCAPKPGTTITNAVSKAERPNLVIIQTDEHNFRTLGCYRDLMAPNDAFVWGPEVKVETPNIDRIADEGVICDAYYASSPVCAPSRASMMSGLYPIATDVRQNNIPMNAKIRTFAQVLKDQGYATSYGGKWHLEGEKKYARINNSFGWTDKTTMFNGGHNPYLRTTSNGWIVPLNLGKYRNLVAKGDTANIHYVTDFLTDRSLDILARDKGKPFCLMLSIPDPHTPNIARPPYDEMYSDLDYQAPATKLIPEAQRPKWALIKSKNQGRPFDAKYVEGYLGMVKCIDDNVGRILNFLDKEGLTENTIVVFTSDHGDMIFEHDRSNKGVPFEASARIPFLIRYPAQIPAGKKIGTPYTTVDFAPTLLGLMGAPALPDAVGLNDAATFTAKGKDFTGDRITYFSTTGGAWVAALDGRHKLVLSKQDQPWLYDLKKDPQETVNVYQDPTYATVVKALREELLQLIQQHNDPAVTGKGDLIY